MSFDSTLIYKRFLLFGSVWYQVPFSEVPHNGFEVRYTSPKADFCHTIRRFGHTVNLFVTLYISHFATLFKHFVTLFISHFVTLFKHFVTQSAFVVTLSSILANYSSILANYSSILSLSTILSLYISHVDTSISTHHPSILWHYQPFCHTMYQAFCPTKLCISHFVTPTILSQTISRLVTLSTTLSISTIRIHLVTPTISSKLGYVSYTTTLGILLPAPLLR